MATILIITTMQSCVKGDAHSIFAVVNWLKKFQVEGMLSSSVKSKNEVSLKPLEQTWYFVLKCLCLVGEISWFLAAFWGLQLN